MSASSKRSANNYTSLPSKRLRGLQTYRPPSLSLPNPDDVTVPFAEPSDLLASFTPDASKKLLTTLLNDPALRPGVTAHIQAQLSASFPAYVSSIRHRAQKKLEPLSDPEDHREKGIISAGDLAEACAPFLHDVVRAARMPVPGAAKESLALLRSIHDLSIPDPENVADGEEERAQFDQATDALMVGLLKRMRDEGDKEAFAQKWLKTLRQALRRTVDACQGFDMEDLFAETLGLLEEWLGSASQR